jgi:alpha-ketoglutarate-dependent taurine dioxygenase
MHHIISDGWSAGVLIQEVAELYEAFSQGRLSSLPELSVHYADYALWQRQWLQGEVLDTKLDYWKQTLGGSLPILQLPTTRPRSTTRTHEGAIQTFTLSATLSESLQKLSHQEGVTLFMTLLAAFQTLLHRYSGQTDLVLGTDIANRNQTATESLIGFFVNLLVLRTDLSGQPSFRALLKRVRSITLEAYAHQDVPFGKLVEVLQPERSLGSTPLFQVLFVLQNAPMPTLEFAGLKLTPMQVDSGTAKFDLALFLEETEQGLVGTCNYSTDLFDRSMIARLLSQFETLLNSIVTDPDAQITALDILTPAEKQQQAMNKQERKALKLKKFAQTEAKEIRFSQDQLIHSTYLQPEQPMPLVLQPTIADLDLVDWAATHRDWIEAQLLKHGAILFRGFSAPSVAMFEALAQTLCSGLFAEYEDLPREGVSGKVYGSTPYPPDQAILFHNESSHLHRFPLKIWFFCVQPAQQGGETPIVDCRKVYHLLDPALRSQFAQKQLMYIRNYTPGLDVSWQEFFHTQERSSVEAYCRQAAISFEWQAGGGLTTRQRRPAIVQHPKTKEWVFFNQIQLHHPSCLDPAVRSSLLSLFGEDKLPRHVCYGDGTPIEDAVIAEIRAVYEAATVRFPWQQGDILMLDNLLAAHGRSPYIGSRKIVVAMGDMTQSETINHAGRES